MASARATDQSQLERLAEEQAALRRVATLVAEGAPAETLFARVAEQVAEVLRVPVVSVLRYEPDGTAAERASFSPQGTMFRVGTRWSLEGTNVVAQILESGRPARIDDYSGLTGVIAETVRSVGIRSTVGIPIVVSGRLWGAMVVSSTGPGLLPGDTEVRLANFTELVGTAIANTEARDEAQRLADEQAALRRVATLVAQDVPSSELFRAVAREVGTLLGADFSGMIRYEDDATVTPVAAWAAAGEHPPVPDRFRTEAGDPTTMVAETRRPARVDDWSGVPGPIAVFIREELEVSSSVGCPIVVEGRLWGALAVHSKQSEPLPPDTESRIAQFSDLVATAIANAEARAEVARLAQEQAALRRVATLVAREASQGEVFTAIAEEIGQVFNADDIRVYRYEDDRNAVVVGGWGYEDFLPVGSRHRLGGTNSASLVFQTGQPARIDDYATTASGAIGDQGRSSGIGCVVAAPIAVEGRLWGAISVATRHEEPLPPEAGLRLGQFTELMATAVANAESHARADRLAEEQAALRRVATLIAEESPPADVFAKVAEELASVIGDVDCMLGRDDGDGTVSVVAASGAGMAATVRVGERFPIDGNSVVASVLRAGRPYSIDDYSATRGTTAERGRQHGIRSAAGCPILVRDRTWGVVAVARYEAGPLPPETELRVAKFTDLVATAIANADARAEVERLADEQAALRRVATQVAEGAPPTAILDAVAGEMERLLDADQVALNRFEPSDEIIVLAHRGLDVARTPVGSRVSLEGESVTATVRRTGRPARMEGYERAPGALAELARVTGLRSSVAAPIVVDGRLWGIITASWKGEASPPPDTEARMARFAQLLDTAIANADSRDQLRASRARLLTAGDDARRRVVRDLHDGAQQRLVHTIVTLKLAQEAFQQDDAEAESLVAEALEHATRGNEELRELARGILPVLLTRGGLRIGIDSVVRRLDLPVQVDVPAERFPAEIEASAYFIVAEALTNVVKHSHAERAEVTASVVEGTLRVEVRDDGIGGADRSGHGLVGIADRTTALGGRLEIESPAGVGTIVSATLPLSAG